MQQLFADTNSSKNILLYIIEKFSQNNPNYHLLAENNPKFWLFLNISNFHLNSFMALPYELITESRLPSFNKEKKKTK